MTDIQTEWHSHHLLEGYFKQDTYWFDADGNVFEIDEMNPHYLLNVVCFLERVAPTIFEAVKWDQKGTGYPDSARWLVNQPLYIKIKNKVKENLGA
jgi:hypothetical protein